MKELVELQHDLVTSSGNTIAIDKCLLLIKDFHRFYPTITCMHQNIDHENVLYKDISNISQQMYVIN